MKILIINSGSSSIKYQLMVMPANEVICTGMIDRIGLESSNVTFKTSTDSYEETVSIPTHKVGLQKVANMLLDAEKGVIKSTSEITAVGHRVVHGGSNFTDTVKIDEKVKAKIKQLFDLAPLHNPANLEGITVAEEIFHTADQIAVFDTAFHQTMPEVAYKFAIPNELLTEKRIRVYGFHGTSHKYVSEQAIKYLKGIRHAAQNIITIHLGNGCSMTAIKNGKSVDHSFGFGPTNGLIMGTRAGDVDQSVIFYMANSLGYSLDEINEILQKKSGMLGLTGYSDLRDIEANAEKGDKECQLALFMNAYRIRKFIGSYTAALNGLDAIVFTAGIGENSSYMRKLVCTDMEFFGIDIDDEENQIRSKEIREINKTTSKVKVLIVPTDEEYEIANQVYHLLQN
ncbi:acetate kinase [Flavobacterium sp. Fl-318]|uniref:Acetate kinase n=1 Tax=Flavobacterium cupriresistens TaxID=2893885 RepID=A0ABU4RAS5_9FLAO|nr:MULTISPECIES: acetate kinase [unclassified Flavobacterium]MDX6189687.1 acetate kinase [Flavobacterium sp. Fl-318]UFH40907.1 acetate kinase [Flavobacterium sp. F-323]